MAKVYAPILNVSLNTWVLGIIENHQPYLPSREEVQKIADQLNAKALSAIIPRTVPATPLSDFKHTLQDLRKEMGRISVAGDIKPRDTRLVADALAVVIDYLAEEVVK